MTQLRGADVAKRRVGGEEVWVMTITPDAGGTKDGKKRDVPLHPHLIEQGGRRAAAARPAAGRPPSGFAASRRGQRRRRSAGRRCIAAKRAKVPVSDTEAEAE